MCSVVTHGWAHNVNDNPHLIWVKLHRIQPRPVEEDFCNHFGQILQSEAFLVEPTSGHGLEGEGVLDREYSQSKTHRTICLLRIRSGHQEESFLTFLT